MSRLADGSRTDSRRATHVIASTEGNASGGAPGVPSTCLMATGSGLTIPRLDGVAVAHQLRQGEQATARLARAFVQGGLAKIDDWISAKRNPFEFLKRSLDRWLKDHRVCRIQEQFFLDLTISTSLDRYFAPNDCSPADASEVFLTLEPESAGYIIMGPTLRLLEAAHARLPATFVQLFLNALNRWVRVYDYRDALDRVERLRDWYESDPEGGEVELPDIKRCIPPSLKRRPLSAKSVAKIVPCIENQLARQLMELVVELNLSSSQGVRPEIGEGTRELLMDCGEPVPALLAVFERNDSIEGCFDEECQGMLELTPEPNLIVPFNGDSRESVVGAFAALATVAHTLSCASQLMSIMPGNERVN